MEHIIALAGNPNVGKSVFFNALIGSYRADVSNYPGTTVELTQGLFRGCGIVDTPGVTGLSADNEEERVAKDAIHQADRILNVVDAVNLKRDLFLTLQLAQLGKPMLIALNLMDDAARQGFTFDIKALEKRLGIPVIPTSGRRGTGLDQVKAMIARDGFIAPKFSASKNGGAPSAPVPKTDFPTSSEELRLAADRLAALVIKRPGQRPTFSSSLSRTFLNPILGLPLLTLMLATIFLVFGKVVAQTVVGFTQTIVMGTWYFNWITGLLYPLLDPDSLLGGLLIGEYGILTMVPIYLLGLLLPLVTSFYFLISLLEDSGLLPRLAVLSDRIFTRFGLNGKAVIPTLLGFGCVTMALVTTRILGSKRERLIASALLCVAIPCSAQFTIILSAASFLTLPYLIVYSSVIAAVFFITGSLLNLLMPGSSTDLFLTLPPLRLPAGGNLIKKTARKTRQFLCDTGMMFLLGSLIITSLNDIGGFQALHRLLSPLTQTLLGLPGETAALFVMSIIKRDLGAAGLYSIMQQGLLTQPQLTVALIVMTLFVPCFASLFVLWKEQGPVAAALIWLGSFLAAFTVGGAASLFLR